MKQSDNAMALASLLSGICVVDPDFDREITHVCSDSRLVKAGSLFIAYKGGTSDARDYIPQAIEAGAQAILCESDSETDTTLLNQTPIFYHAKVRENIAKIAARFYHHPSRRIQITGVTGTNGKTSVTHFIASAFASLSQPCAVMGTVGNGLPNALTPATHTTPSAIELQQQLAQWLEQGIEKVAMEVSSHALSQSRTRHVEFHTAVFTNLTREHLDYHGTMEAYGQAKAKLFQQFGLQFAVLNVDDPFSEQLKAVIDSSIKVVTYGCQNSADVSAQDIAATPSGLQMTVVTPHGQAPLNVALFGRFNVYNLLASITTLICQGVDWKQAIDAHSALGGVSGRMELLQAPQKPAVIVDYAHTPDALANALSACRQHTSGKLWCVFGCGGDRDKGKRALMGEVACQYADHIIITDDNPRTEQPASIVSDIMTGVTEKDADAVIHDRRQAIELAIERAGPDDVILVAGKGHEDYQIIGQTRHSFSDQAVVKEIFAQ